MRNILDYIEKVKQENEGPRITVAELTNMNTPDLEQSPDSFLRPGETLEDWDVSFRRPNADGGVQQLVAPSVDGSRPGYNGLPRFVTKDPRSKSKPYRVKVKASKKLGRDKRPSYRDRQEILYGITNTLSIDSPEWRYKYYEDLIN